NASERRWVARFIDEEVSFYLPMSGIGFLSRGSVNQAAGLGMEYIISKLSGSDKNLLKFPTFFLSWVWIKAWAYFGTKLINPRRKTNTLLDMRARLTSRRGKIDREPLQLALSYKIYELIMISRGQKYKLKVKPQNPGSYLLAAELL